MRDNSDEKLKQFIPGPGQYDHSNVIGKDGPHKTISAKYSANLVEKELRSKPGPGTYEPNMSATLKASPNLRIGSSLRDDLAFKK